MALRRRAWLDVLRRRLLTNGAPSPTAGRRWEGLAVCGLKHTCERRSAPAALGLSVHSELHHTVLCFFALLPNSASVVLRSIMLPTSSATARKGQNATNPPLVYVVLAVFFRPDWLRLGGLPERTFRRLPVGKRYPVLRLRRRQVLRFLLSRIWSVLPLLREVQCLHQALAQRAGQTPGTPFTAMIATSAFRSTLTD